MLIHVVIHGNTQDNTVLEGKQPHFRLEGKQPPTVPPAPTRSPAAHARSAHAPPDERAGAPIQYAVDMAVDASGDDLLGIDDLIPQRTGENQ